MSSSLVVFDTRVAHDAQLRASDLRVYAALLEAGAWNDFVESSARTLAAALHLALSTVYASLRRLAERGYVERQRAGSRKTLYHAHVKEAQS